MNFSRHKDTVIDDRYAKQSRATDPEERRRLLRAFEKRLYDEEVHAASVEGARLDDLALLEPAARYGVAQ